MPGTGHQVSVKPGRFAWCLALLVCLEYDNFLAYATMLPDRYSKLVATGSVTIHAHHPSITDQFSQLRPS